MCTCKHGIEITYCALCQDKVRLPNDDGTTKYDMVRKMKSTGKRYHGGFKIERGF